MAAPIGNDFAVGHGRPRDLGRELRRAELAAQHVARLVDRPGSITSTAKGLADRYKAGDRSLPFVDSRTLAGLSGDRVEIEIREQLLAKSRNLLLAIAPSSAGLLDDIAEGVLIAAAAARPKGRRRRHKNTEQEWEQRVATAAVALDRLVPDDPEMPQ